MRQGITNGDSQPLQVTVIGLLTLFDIDPDTTRRQSSAVTAPEIPLLLLLHLEPNLAPQLPRGLGVLKAQG
ncbi:hypothetical protein HALA3H3_p10031 [Halomonas sp. A3H3]|nr:hypothetical protein HALA3H3_p10031 [Halomonas sp. A3H3]